MNYKVKEVKKQIGGNKMKQYKSYYESREQYINLLIEGVKKYTKMIEEATDMNIISVLMDFLHNQQQLLVAEGFTLEEVEQLER